jgi:hypothetical protein
MPSERRPRTYVQEPGGTVTFRCAECGVGVVASTREGWSPNDDHAFLCFDHTQRALAREAITQPLRRHKL